MVDDDWATGLVVGLTLAFVVTIAVAVTVAVMDTEVHGTRMVQGQSVMVNVVASATVNVLVPWVNCVGNGQNVVYRVTTVVVYDVDSLLDVLAVVMVPDLVP